MAALTSTWFLVVPVKDRMLSKSRLQPPEGVARAELAHAMALDTLEVVLQVVPAAQVVVVTADDRVGLVMRERGTVVLPDPGRGLNPAIEAGLAWVTTNAPGRAGAVLLADLPTLTPEVLYAGLRACAAAESAVVPDSSGLGTVLLAHHDAARLRPSFGPGSAARHARRATVLDLDLPQLRHDVDDLPGLRAAYRMGFGRHTAAVLGIDGEEAS
ncbi:2-phospho-L-lactate guanylyltransferase [Calidifontibacter sp. DB0510]|uniref:2-phospho-L-lactate guanylyltransferase n=1 Tax=Metallococcus carri TaxID=1656884 RepID=A0A967AZ95_9MICO|nr:2-phospho-L-lactate guanylyltransferase [Metallococcus carri]NHN54478.1 2-phospho-L-lactate guanylyltransferase [Metallococcus carri]NOP36683.1 2-phospho-L-lactate guanylyltransferase [Calidifontibacter sp. DB2511S]